MAFRLHYAVQHELEKPLGLLWLYWPSTVHLTIRYITTSITFKNGGGKTRTELSDRAEQQFTQNTVRAEASKNPLEKTPIRKKKKTRQEIWVGSIAHALKSPSYEGYTARRSLPLNMYSNKARKILNNFRKRKQTPEIPFFLHQLCAQGPICKKTVFKLLQIFY